MLGAARGGLPALQLCKPVIFHPKVLPRSHKITHTGCRLVDLNKLNGTLPAAWGTQGAFPRLQNM